MAPGDAKGKRRGIVHVNELHGKGSGHMLRELTSCALTGLDGLHGLEGVEDAIDDAVGEDRTCVYP